jgi:flagellar protein FlbD
VIVFKRLGGQLIALNPDLIERVEATPDTVVTMIDDKKFLVDETLEEVLKLITDYRAYVIARSNDLAVSQTDGRPTLHVVPNELITSDENIESYATGLEGVDLEFEPEPDGRVHLEFRGGASHAEFGDGSGEDADPAAESALAEEQAAEPAKEGSIFGFGGRN